MAKYEVYATLLVLAIVFTTIDLAVSTFQLAIPSLIFSSITMVIGFIGAYLSRTISVEQKYEDAVGYIKKNFGVANTILSVLDVVCCVLALLTGVFVVMLVFRLTIAIRIAVYINKYRSVAFAVWAIAYMHIFKKFKRRKVAMTKFTILQKILLTITAVFGVGGVVVGVVPEFAGIANEVTKYVAMVSEAIAVASGIWLGTTHDEVLTEEEIIEKQNANAKKEALKMAKVEYKKLKKQEINALAENIVVKQEEEKSQENVTIAKEM